MDHTPAPPETPGPDQGPGAVGFGQALDELDAAQALLVCAEVPDTWGECLSAIARIEARDRADAAQKARLAAKMVELREAEREATGRSTRGVRREAADEIGLVRHLNATAASRKVAWAVELPELLPRLWKKLLAGEVSEEDVEIVFERTRFLDPAGHHAVDRRLKKVVGRVGARDLRGRVDGLVAELDPDGAAERMAKAAAQRRTTFRPGADSMMSMTALLPGAAGAAVQTILRTQAARIRAAGDRGERTLGQIEADLLTGIITAWAIALNLDIPGLPDLPDPAMLQIPGNESAHTGPEPGQETAPIPGTDGLGENSAQNRSESGQDGGRSIAAGLAEDDAEAADDAAGDAGDGSTVAGGEGGLDPWLGFTDLPAAVLAFRHPLSATKGGVSGSRRYGRGVGSGFAGLVSPNVGVNVDLVITDLALFGVTDTPAELVGLGPIPATVARAMVAEAVNIAGAELRRLYTDPSSGQLVGMEAKSRIFPAGLAKMIGLRDRFCRHPYCDANIRHIDHIQPHSQGGSTSYENGQGLCARHNLAKDTHGDTTRHGGPVSESNGTVEGGDPGSDGSDGDLRNEVESYLEANLAVGLAADLGADLGDRLGADHGARSGPRPSSGPGDDSGGITTTLATGQSFTSPARPFPHETRASIPASPPPGFEGLMFTSIIEYTGEAKKGRNAA